ncbi:MAG: zinc ABC transporter substrate-binding protein [Anaerolineae bacterium]|nr:zinc ABC transporter substrate-binding protein [Anaerolineae bacterium]
MSNRFLGIGGWAATALLLVLVVGAGCARASGTAAGQALQVTVSILPQQYFVDRIGGEHVQVGVMVEPGANPATYEPKPEQLVALSRSALYFRIGVPFEDVWMPKIAAANPEMTIVDTAAGIDRIPIADHDHGEDHDEGEHDEGPEGALDPHIWLSPRLVAIQAQHIADALIAAAPAHEARFRDNLAAFLAEIEALDAEIADTLSGVSGARFLVFHPSWGYFAQDYGLEQIAIEVGGQEPSAQELARLIETAKADGIRVVFAQPEFSTVDARTIAGEIGGQVLLVSPLAPDWLANMQRVAETFAQALGDRAGG